MMATILVVDDDPDVLSLTRMTFECGGHEVMATSDGARAIELVESTPPDAIVLDVMMPGLSGWEVLARLRERPETRWVPVLMLSALDDTMSRVRGLKSGADDYLSKPFDPAELAARVERLMERQGREVAGFEGRFSACPLAEVAQTLEGNEHSGEVQIRSAGGTGSIELEGGRVVRAEFEGLRDAEAVRAMLELEEGYFRFQEDEGAPAERGPGLPAGLSIRQLALEVAWVRDELQRRAPHLPAADEPLVLAEEAAPPEARSLSEASLWVREYLRRYPGATLARLLAQHAASPGQVRLAVARLVERGLVRVEADGRRPGVADVAVDRAFRDLLQDSVFRGLSLAGVRVVQLVDPAAWDGVDEVIRGVPESLLGDGGEARESLLATRAGTLRLRHKAGALDLDLVPLTFPLAELELPLDTTGVVLWLGERTPGPQLAAAVANLDGRAAQGVQRLLVAGSDELRRQALELVGNRLCWRVALDRVSAIEDLFWGLTTGEPG